MEKLPIIFVNHYSDNLFKMNNLEQFCLTWNDFKDNMALSFRELRGSSDFTDVTLACEGNHKIEAHKVILAASSPVFREILKTTTQYNPLIYMRGIRARDLDSIVDFIYHGEVNILQDDVNDFLALAGELQLKGIARTNEKEIPQPVIILPTEKLKYLKFKPRRQEIVQADIKVEHNVDEDMHAKKYNKNCLNVRQNQEPKVKLKEENTLNEHSFEEMNDSNIGSALVNNSDDPELDSIIITMMEKSDSAWKCKNCGKTDRRKQNIMSHIEAMHMEDRHRPCDMCGKSCR